MKFYFCRKNNGLTLIELLIAVVITGILAAGFYRAFINQQRVYTVQGQVADMQQNARIALGKMVREIRMAGFGGLDYALGGGVNGFNQSILLGSSTITIVGAFKPVKRDNGDPIQIASISGSQVTLNYATDEFDTSAHRYISIGGIESNTVQWRSGAVLTLAQPPLKVHPVGTRIFEIQAITYTYDGDQNVIRRDQNTGGGGQSVAENIENLQFQYFDKNGNSTSTPADVRLVKVIVTARTDMADPEFKGGDGYRRRKLSSSVRLRNF